MSGKKIIVLAAILILESFVGENNALPILNEEDEVNGYIQIITKKVATTATVDNLCPDIDATKTRTNAIQDYDTKQNEFNFDVNDFQPVRKNLEEYEDVVMTENNMAERELRAEQRRNRRVKRHRWSDCSMCYRLIADMCIQHCRGICNLWC